MIWYCMESLVWDKHLETWVRITRLSVCRRLSSVLLWRSMIVVTLALYRYLLGRTYSHKAGCHDDVFDVNDALLWSAGFRLNNSVPDPDYSVVYRCLLAKLSQDIPYDFLNWKLSSRVYLPNKCPIKDAMPNRRFLSTFSEDLKEEIIMQL